MKGPEGIRTKARGPGAGPVKGPAAAPSVAKHAEPSAGPGVAKHAGPGVAKHTGPGVAPCCTPGPAKGAAGHSTPRAGDDLDRLVPAVKALSDPVRLRMLELMVQGRACCGFPDPAARGVPGSADPSGICVCEFQSEFGLGQSTTSYHLRVLREAGLVREESRGKWTFYELDREAAEDALARLRDLLRL